MLPRTDPDRPFAEPWHAQVFAMTHALSAAGHFAWSEWAAHFGRALEQARDAGGSGDGSDYYDVWLAALESFLIEARFADPARLQELRAAWTNAYLTTPHGAPVELPAP